MVAMVEMMPVDSTNIESIGYDERRKELYVKFKGDGTRIYKYVQVPAMVWEHMLRAKSKGRFVKEILIPYFQFTCTVSNGNPGKVASQSEKGHRV
jgi:hypothetical protein